MLIKDVPTEKVKIPSIIINEGKNVHKYLYARRHFAMELLTLNEKIVTMSDRDKFYTYTIIEGEGKLRYKNGEELIKKGETILIPAYLGEFEIKPLHKCEIFKIYVPNLKKDIIDNLLNRGYNKKIIINLGGYNLFNDLQQFFN